MSTITIFKHRALGPSARIFEHRFPATHREMFHSCACGAPLTYTQYWDTRRLELLCRACAFECEISTSELMDAWGLQDLLHAKIHQPVTWVQGAD